MSEVPDGMRSELRWINIPVNSELSESRVHPGQKSHLARDRMTGELSHAVIGDRFEPDEDRDESESRLTDLERESGAAHEDAPDISALVPLALVAAAGVALGAIGVRAVQK